MIASPSSGLAVIVVSGGVVSTVNVRLAGLASALPRPSIARTSKLCSAPDNGPVVYGELQGANVPPSTRHSNVAGDSLVVNSKAGVVCLVAFAGPVVIVVPITLSSADVVESSHCGTARSVRPSRLRSAACGRSGLLPVASGSRGPPRTRRAAVGAGA